MVNIINNDSLKSRILKINGSTVARNTSFALLDEDSGNVSSTQRLRKERILGLVPTSINSPRIKLTGSNEFKVHVKNDVVARLNEFWPVVLNDVDVRKIVILVDRKDGTKDNKPTLLRLLQSEFSTSLTAEIVLKTISVLRGSGLLQSERGMASGAAVLNRSSAVLGNFILGDGERAITIRKTPDLPGVSPIQALEILQKSKIKDIVFQGERRR